VVLNVTRVPCARSGLEVGDLLAIAIRDHRVHLHKVGRDAHNVVLFTLRRRRPCALLRG